MRLLPKSEMQKVPQIVRRHLAAAPAPEVHPGPDLLTAFAERDLGVQERALVLDHLALCPDCREVLMLALPQLPESATHSMAVPDRVRWLGSTRLRWASAATCVVVLIAGTGLWLRRPSPSLEKLSSRPVSVAELKTKAAPGPEAPAYETGGAARVDGKPRASAQVASNPEPRMAAKLEQKSAVQRGSLPATASPTAASDAGAPMSSIDRVPDSAPVEIAQLTPGKAKQPVPGAARVASTVMPESEPPAAPRNTAALLHLPESPRWLVSSDGELQRSFDAGQNWERVSVADNPVFRAVSSFGAEVWAGGISGILYHSSDAGHRWTLVKPAFQGSALSADIIRIEFHDADHGRLITRNGENWTTADAGQTWRRF